MSKKVIENGDGGQEDDDDEMADDILKSLQEDALREGIVPLEQESGSDEELKKALDGANRSGGETKLKDWMMRLYVKLRDSPKNHKKRFDLITVLHKLGDLEEMREQCDQIISMHLMPSDFWLFWIEVEKNANTDAQKVVQQIFERAVKDVPNPKLYLEYIEFACTVSLAHTRQVMEEAVNEVGLWANYASVVWNAYIDFEKVILESMSGDEAKIQKELILRLYGRFLSIPHHDHEESWNDYIRFCSEDVSDTYKSVYERAAKYYSKIADFEERLMMEEDDASLLEVYNEYIESEIRRKFIFTFIGGNPSRIRALFERAIDASLKSPDVNIWLQYCSWLDSKLKAPHVSVTIYNRAVRHVCSSGLWQQYLTAMERAKFAPCDIDSKWADALDSICTPEDGLSLFRTYIYLVRRRLGEGEKDLTMVLKIFEDGMNFLRDKFGSHWDSPQAQYRKNYALFLYTTAKKPNRASQIWDDILKSGNGHLAAYWLEAANLERFFGDINNSRKLLYRAINSTSDHPYSVFEALLQFEREVGTLEDLDRALEKVNAQANRISSRPSKSKSKEFDLKKRVLDKPSESNQRERSKTGRSVEHEPSAKKAKLVDDEGFLIPNLPAQHLRTSPSAEKAVKSSVRSASKHSESKATSSDEDKSEGSDDSIEKSHAVFISNLDFKLPKEAIESIFPKAKEVRLIHRGMSKLHKGYGYVDFLRAKDALEALKCDRTLINGRPLYVSEYKPHGKGEQQEFRFHTGLEKNKLFINNVHYDATEEQLKELFEPFGPIVGIRIVTHKSGKSKGCAYIEYSNEESAGEAIKASGNLILLERTLTVVISNPPRRDQSKPQINVTHQRSKIDLTPRSVKRPEASDVVTKDESDAGSQSKKMSNDQFRSFFK